MDEIQELPERLKEKARIELNETDENKHDAISQLRVSATPVLRVFRRVYTVGRDKGGTSVRCHVGPFT